MAENPQPDAPVEDLPPQENLEAEDKLIQEQLEAEAQEAPEEEVVPEPEPEPEPEERKHVEPIPADVALAWKRDAKTLGRELEGIKGELAKLSKLSGPSETPEDVPDFEQNPVEFLKWQGQKIMDRIEAQETRMEQAARQNQDTQAQTHVNALEKDFAKDNPDYFQAVQHLQVARVKELQETFGMTEEQALRRFGEDTAMFIGTHGADFPKMAYAMAQKMGFKAPKQEAKADPEESLKSIAKKQAQARSLASTGGKPAKDEITPEDVENMSDKEFDKMFTGPDGDENFRRLFGG